nr:hypothetical protein [Actinomycetales bacterium]
MLDSLGVTATQRKVYHELSGSPGSGIADIAAQLGITRAEVEGALAALEELGLTQRSTLTTSGWRVLHPAVTQIPAAVTLSARISEVAATAKEELLAFLVGELTPAHLDEVEGIVGDLLKRGVLVRILYIESSRQTPAIRDFVQHFTERRGLVRSVPSLPARLALVDESTAVVASAAPGPQNEGLIVKSPILLASLAALFEQYWEEGSPVSNSAPVDSAPITRPATPLSRQEQNVLTLLARGMKDAAIAEQMDLSERTVARVITGLYDHTGSETRFELGMKASRFGWI